MIPKIIHYCWFGDTKMPDEYIEYIKEWSEKNIGYTIMKWDEKNSPMDLPYLKKAKAHKKWANMSNLVRFYALKEYGGIYLDVDMKIIHSFNELLNDKCFLGFETGTYDSPCFWVNNAVIGSVPNHKFIKLCYNSILEQFDGLEEANESAPRIVTKILREKYKLIHGGYQKLKDITLYSKEVFYPILYNEMYKLKEWDKYISEKTMAIHTWGRSWFSREKALMLHDDLQKEYSHKLEEIIKYTDEISQQNELINSLRTSISEKENSHSTLEIQHLKDLLVEKENSFSFEMEQIKATLYEKEEGIKTCYKVMEDIKQQHEEYVDKYSIEIKEKDTLLEMLKTKELVITNQLNAVEVKLQETQTDLLAKEEKHQKLEQDYTNTITGYKEEFFTLTFYLKNAQKDIEDKKKNIAILSENIIKIKADAEHKINSYIGNEIALKTTLNFKNQQIEELQEGIKKINEQTEVLKNESRGKINQLQEQVYECKVQLETKNIQLDVYQKELSEIKLEYTLKIKILEEHISSLQIEIEHKNKLIDEQKNSLNQINQKYAVESKLLSEMIVKLEKKVEENNGSIIDYEKNIIKLQYELNDREKSIHQMEESMQITTKNIHLLNKEIEKLIYTRDNLMQDLNEKENTINMQKVDHLQLHNSIEKMKYGFDTFRIEKQIDYVEWEKKQQVLIEKIAQKELFYEEQLKEKNRAIEWYISTYQNRKLIGIIKDRIFKEK